MSPVHAHGSMPGSSQCDLFVLVSSVMGLPMVPVAPSTSTSIPQQATRDASVRTRAPSAFVAVKAARDIVNSGSVQGTTRVIQEQCNPVWCVPNSPVPQSTNPVLGFIAESTPN
jgi:hypothetical protein